MAKKFCNGAKQEYWKLEFIRNNVGKLTVPQLCDQTGLSEAFMYEYCAYMKYSTRLRPEFKYKPPPISRKIMQYYKDPKPLVRPKAVYDNPSHEDVLNKYLEMEV